MKTIKSIDKMVAMLDIFADHHELSLNEICELTGFPKTSAFDMIRTLKVHQFLQQDPLTNKYALGVALLKYGGLYSARNPLKKKSDAVCARLSKKYEATVHLTIPESGEVIYIGKYEDPNTKVSASRIGTQLPMSCTGVGKAILAFKDEDYLNEYVLSKPLPVYTENSIKDEKTLRSELEKVRVRGYALDDEEIIMGIRCVAAPIFDLDNEVIGSISVSKLAPSINDSNLDDIVHDVLKAASEISIS